MFFDAMQQIDIAYVLIDSFTARKRIFQQITKLLQNSTEPNAFA
jgi:hypothetical protein